MAYLETTIHYGVENSINVTDPFPILDLYVDSDHGGCIRTGRSTSGAHLELATKGAAFRLGHHSKVQTVTALSSTEAEYVSMATGLMDLGMPAQQSWEDIIGEMIMLKVNVDNEGSRAIAESGDTKKLKYLNKHQRARQSFVRDTLHERIEGRLVQRVDTKVNKADLLTQGLERLAHTQALSLARLYLNPFQVAPA